MDFSSMVYSSEGDKNLFFFLRNLHVPVPKHLVSVEKQRAQAACFLTFWLRRGTWPCKLGTLKIKGSFFETSN